jgi:hypothetical protein
MASFGFYSDSNLTQPISGNFQISSGTSDYLFYIGNVSESIKLQDATYPGVSIVYLSINDATVGSGPEATWIKLALTQAGLTSAVAGQSLALGSTILGGVQNALPIWVRISNSLSGATSSTDLSLKITGVKEFAV